MQRLQLLSLPEPADPQNVNKDAPLHRKRLQVGTLRRRFHALCPRTTIVNLFKPPSAGVHLAAPESGVSRSPNPPWSSCLAQLLNGQARISQQNILGNAFPNMHCRLPQPIRRAMGIALGGLHFEMSEQASGYRKAPRRAQGHGRPKYATITYQLSHSKGRPDQ